MWNWKSKHTLWHDSDEAGLAFTRGTSSFAAPGIISEYEPDSGWRLIACMPFEAGATVAAFGGSVLRLPWYELPADARLSCVQIDENLFLMSDVRGGADHVNHSCDPNLWLEGQVVLVARRPIQPGEELSYDYAMSDGCPYDEFPCSCGASLCRGVVTGADWANEELKSRYGEHFSPYLLRRQARTHEQA